MSQLIRDVGRSLRFRSRDDIVGNRVSITTLSELPTALTDFAQEFQSDVESISCSEQLSQATGTLAKFGIMHVAFTCTSTQLDSLDFGGIDALNQLGFLDSSRDDMSFDDDRDFCVRLLDGEIREERVYLLLNLRATNNSAFENSLAERIRWLKHPELIPFPLQFAVEDACLTNARNVWFFKHNYAFYYMLNTY